MLLHKCAIILTATMLLFFIGCKNDTSKREDSVELCTDGIDNDGDGVIDCVDPGCAEACNSIDTDGDGVPDYLDACMGSDDSLDADEDGVPDGCDTCPGGDDTLDADGDLVPDACDLCEGEDDTVDGDGDGIPDACDLCEGEDDTLDADADGVPDACDICADGDDTLDADGDGTPDACDLCPLTIGCNLCYQASYMLDEVCDFVGATAAIGWDCETDEHECEAACVLDSDCMTVATLIGTSPDPDLSACMNACDPSNQCTLCTTANCNAEFNACTADSPCTAFLQCSQQCTDATCIETCHTNFPSDLALDLEACMCTSCDTSCTLYCQ